MPYNGNTGIQKELLDKLVKKQEGNLNQVTLARLVNKQKGNLNQVTLARLVNKQKGNLKQVKLVKKILSGQTEGGRRYTSRHSKKQKQKKRHLTKKHRV
uniref:Uncharacterized protein n=1 Tax=viral metagenome TaxID=1070528 RepID=A0A6C0DUI6_9ZZZZ